MEEEVDLVDGFFKIKRGNWNNAGHWNNGPWNGNMFGSFQGKRCYIVPGFGNNGAFGRNCSINDGKGVMDPSTAAVICQICFKPQHIAAECRNRYNKEFIPFYSPSSYNYFQNSIPRAAYLTSSEVGLVHQCWYLDSGATYHLTNNLQNLNLRVEYSGNQLLHVGNDQGLHISHIGYTCFYTSCNSLPHLKDILCVPAITKNFISISKLLEDNNITVEFVANMCFIKDKKKTVHLAQGIVRGRLYQLL